jgi:hypothetical protein
MKRYLLTIAMAGVMACGGGSKEQSEAEPLTGTPINLGAITVIAPEAWTSQPPSSSMRKAQFVLPQAGEAGDAELVVFYFGSGNAGSVEANLQRWRGQMKGAEGETTKSTANGMAVTTLDVTGAYASSMGPTMQSGPEKANSRMIASIVESPAGAYYFKLTGPEKTVAHWQKTFAQFIASAKGA